MDKFLETARKAAYQAGKFLAKNQETENEVSYKDAERKNPVSHHDVGAEEIILHVLAGEYPDHGVLSEESGETGGQSDYKWVIDPLDGTVNYIHGHRYFCVSIALAYKGEVIVAAIYNPVLDEMFSAARGKGTFLNGRGIHVSGTATLNESLISMSFPYGKDSEAFHASARYFSRMSRDSQAVRRDGSTALSLCNVASGRNDGFFVVGNAVWDYAAGMLLVTEAGGTVTDFTGKSVPLKSEGGRLIASNGKIHRAMLRCFEEEGIIRD